MMKNHNNTDRKITVSKTSPWTVSVDGEQVGEYPSRTAARNAAASLKTGTAADLPTGSMLQSLRQAAKLSRGQLAAKLGISVYHLDRVEAGKLAVTPAHAAALS